MRKLYLAVAGATALLIAGACMDRSTPTDASRGIKPKGAAFNVPVSGAGFTTTNPIDDPNTDPASSNDLCQNATDDAPANNCNIYKDKNFVWLSGGPTTAYVGDGDYFFAVLKPGGQFDPNDGAAGNLSDVAPSSGTGAGDTYTDRTYSVAGGLISSANHGTHQLNNNELRLMGYDDTPNPGGVYILAICSLANGYPVKPSDCKYDAFKVHSGECVPTAEDDCGGVGNATLEVTKTLVTHFTRTYKWDPKKSSDPTTVALEPGQSTTVHYTVSVHHDDGTDSGFSYDGVVTVTNTGTTNAHNVTVADNDATITLSCTPSLPVATLAANASISCTYSKNAGSLGATETNSATATWDGIFGPVSATNDPIASGTFTTPTTLVDNCVSVTDPKAGAALPVTVCVGDANPTSIKYDYTVTAPTGTGNCGGAFNVDNTATLTANTDGATTHSDNRIVGTVLCGCTLGYWKNNDLYSWAVVTKPSTYGFLAAASGANGGTSDFFWKNTHSLSAYASWPNGPSGTTPAVPLSIYRTGSSKVGDAQAFGLSALGNSSYTTLKGLSFYQALNLPGGSDFLGKAQNLMRQGTAALLNASWGDGTHTISYPLTGAAVVTAVNNALLTKDAITIDNLQKLLAGYNQAGTQDLTNNNACPVNAVGNWFPH